MTQTILIIIGIAVIALLLSRKTRENIVGICAAAIGQDAKKRENKEKILALLGERGEEGRIAGMLNFLQLLYLFEVFVGEVEEDDTDDYPGHGRVDMDVVEKEKVEGVKHIPDPAPDQDQRQDDGYIFSEISDKISVDHYWDSSTIDF